MNQKNIIKKKVLLIGDKRKRQYLLIKDFNIFMYNHIFYCGKRHFCWYYLQAFGAEEILKCSIKHYFKINDKHRIIIPKKMNMLNSKIMKKIKSLFVIYAHFESILLPEDNRKQNPKEFTQTNIKNMLLTVMAIN